MSDVNTKVVEKVKKLFALANDAGANEHEAAVAMERAYAILAEHNLSVEHLESGNGAAKSSDAGERGRASTVTNYSEKYFLGVWARVAELNFCIYWNHRPNPKLRATHQYMMGRKDNVIVATEMSKYLCDTMKRLARKAAKEAGRDDFKFLNSYLYGMGHRLCQRIRELQRAAEQGKASGSTGNTLPALVNLYEEERYQNWLALGYDIRAPRQEVAIVEDEAPKKAKKQRPLKGRKDFLDQDGYWAGHADAEHVSLAMQVEQGEKQKAIN